jgi:hypothetical protein
VRDPENPRTAFEYGTEISPAYCDVVLRRIAHLTGGEPVLAETGASMGRLPPSAV